MFDYTLNNHFRFGYDGEWFNTPEEHHIEWNCEYGVCQRKPMGFHLECRRTARLISRSTDLIPNLAFSGGVDSEVMVRAFMDENLPFRISIMKFHYDLNLHDISYAVAFCEEHELQYNIIYIDVEAFLASPDLERYARKNKSISPMVCTYFNLFDEMDELPVIGMGEGCIMKWARLSPDYVPGVSEYPSTDWDIVETEKNMAMHRHFIQQDRPAIPAFFRYTPEMMYAFFNDPIMHELALDKRHGKLSSQTSKFEIYQHYYPDLRMRPKFTGFERLMEKDTQYRAHLISLLPQYTRRTLVEYHEGLKRLGGVFSS